MTRFKLDLHNAQQKCCRVKNQAVCGGMDLHKEAVL